MGHPAVRDGQLVGYHPQHRRHHWARRGYSDNERPFVSEHVKLPRKAGLKQVEFSAYAFNKDRVEPDPPCRISTSR